MRFAAPADRRRRSRHRIDPRCERPRGAGLVHAGVRRPFPRAVRFPGTKHFPGCPELSWSVQDTIRTRRWRGAFGGSCNATKNPWKNGWLCAACARADRRRRRTTPTISAGTATGCSRSGGVRRGIDHYRPLQHRGGYRCSHASTSGAPHRSDIRRRRTPDRDRLRYRSPRRQSRYPRTTLGPALRRRPSCCPWQTRCRPDDHGRICCRNDHPLRAGSAMPHSRSANARQDYGRRRHAPKDQPRRRIRLGQGLICPAGGARVPAMHRTSGGDRGSSPLYRTGCLHRVALSGQTSIFD